MTPPPVAATVPGYVRVRIPRRTRAWLLLMQGWDHEKTLGGLWTPALLCCAPLRRSVGGDAQRCPRQPGSSGTTMSGPDPVAQDAAVRRRLSAEARNAVSAADVLPRFGGATTSKSDLIVFDGTIIRRCRLFLLLLGGKDIIIQPHLFNCSNWSHSKWALPFICNGHD